MGSGFVFSLFFSNSHVRDSYFENRCSHHSWYLSNDSVWQMSKSSLFDSWRPKNLKMHHQKKDSMKHWTLRKQNKYSHPKCCQESQNRTTEHTKQNNKSNVTNISSLETLLRSVSTFVSLKRQRKLWFWWFFFHVLKINYNAKNPELEKVTW